MSIPQDSFQLPGGSWPLPMNQYESLPSHKICARTWQWRDNDRYGCFLLCHFCCRVGGMFDALDLKVYIRIIESLSSHQNNSFNFKIFLHSSLRKEPLFSFSIPSEILITCFFILFGSEWHLMRKFCLIQHSQNGEIRITSPLIRDLLLRKSWQLSWTKCCYQ